MTSNRWNSVENDGDVAFELDLNLIAWCNATDFEGPSRLDSVHKCHYVWNFSQGKEHALITIDAMELI